MRPALERGVAERGLIDRAGPERNERRAIERVMAEKGIDRLPERKRIDSAPRVAYDKSISYRH